VTRSRKLIAVTALVGLLAGSGAAFAAMELVSAHSAAEPPLSARVGVNGYGLGGRLGGRGFGGGLGPGSGLGRVQSQQGSVLGSMPAEAVGAVTTYLGVTSSALKAALESGKTLAKVAVAQGKTVDGLVAVMLAVRTKELDHAVTAGQLTASGEKTILARESQRIRDFVDGTRPRGLWRDGEAGAGSITA
jgi:hypothetical protein